MAEATDTAAQEAAEQSVPAADGAAPASDGAAPAADASAGHAAPTGAQPRPDAPQTVGEAMSRDALRPTGEASAGPDVGMVMRIPVTLQAVLGEARMSIARLMKLGPGSVVPLNHKVGDPVDVVVNGRLVARGEVVLLDGEGERFGISLTEIISPGQDSCR